MTTLSKIIVLTFVLWIFPSLVTAQDYHRHRLPLGTRLTVNGQTYQGFVINEYQELLRMDADLKYYTNLHIVHEARSLELHVAVDELKLALGSSDNEVRLLQLERTRLTDLWSEENRLRHTAENSTSWSWLPWTLTGVLGIVTTILIIILGV